MSRSFLNLHNLFACLRMQENAGCPYSSAATPNCMPAFPCIPLEKDVNLRRCLPPSIKCRCILTSYIIPFYFVEFNRPQLFLGLFPKQKRNGAAAAPFLFVFILNLTGWRAQERLCPPEHKLLPTAPQFSLCSFRK